MKAAVVALALILRFAVMALAGEVVRPAPPSAPATTPVTVPVAAPASPKAVEPVAPLKVAPPRDAAKPHLDDVRRARVCFNAAQTRENIAAHRLAEPFRALRVGGQQGEALRAKLCRWRGDEWVYEIAVLRRDGRIVRVYMNALNGQAVGALDDPGRH